MSPMGWTLASQHLSLMSLVLVLTEGRSLSPLTISHVSADDEVEWVSVRGPGLENSWIY